MSLSAASLYRVLLVGGFSSLAFRLAKHCSSIEFSLVLPAGSISASAIAAASGSDGSKISRREISTGSTVSGLPDLPVVLISNDVLLPGFNLFLFFAGLNLRI